MGERFNAGGDRAPVGTPGTGIIETDMGIEDRQEAEAGLTQAERDQLALGRAYESRVDQSTSAYNTEIATGPHSADPAYIDSRGSDQFWVETGEDGKDHLVERRTQSETQVEAWRAESEKTAEALAEPTKKTLKGRISKFIKKIFKRKNTEGAQSTQTDTEQGIRLDDRDIAAQRLARAQQVLEEPIKFYDTDLARTDDKRAQAHEDFYAAHRIIEGIDSKPRPTTKESVDSALNEAEAVLSRDHSKVLESKLLLDEERKVRDSLVEIKEALEREIKEKFKQRSVTQEGTSERAKIDKQIAARQERLDRIYKIREDADDNKGWYNTGNN